MVGPIKVANEGKALIISGFLTGCEEFFVFLRPNVHNNICSSGTVSSESEATTEQTGSTMTISTETEWNDTSTDYPSIETTGMPKSIWNFSVILVLVINQNSLLRGTAGMAHDYK